MARKKKTSKRREEMLIKQSIDFLLPNGSQEDRYSLEEYIRYQLENLNAAAITAALPGVREKLPLKVLSQLGTREIIITEGRNLLKSAHYVNAPI